MDEVNIEQSKFNRVFLRLNSKEQAKFRQYISLNHAGKEIALRVFEHYLIGHEEEKEAWWDKEKLLQLIFEKKANQKIRSITDALSDLYLLIEEFLIWQELQKRKSIENEFLLLDLFKDRNLEDLFQQKIKSLRKKIAKNEGKDNWYFQQLLRLNHYQYFYTSDPNLIKNEKNELWKAMNHLDDFFLATKLKYACELKSREKILQEHYVIQWIETVLKQAKEKETQSHYFKVYRLLFDLIETEAIEVYRELKNWFVEHCAVLDAKEGRQLIGYLVNYMAGKIKTGESHFIEETFELYRLGMEKNFFVENGSLSHTQFNNMVNLACRLQKYTWAKDFIDKWSAYLSKDVRKDATCIAQARLYFEQGDFDRAIETLQFIRFSNVFYHIRARLLLMRCFFELGESNNFIISKCKAFEIFIRRNPTIHKNTKAGFLNFSKALRILLDPKTNKAAKEKKIGQIRPMTYEHWINQKLENLSN